MKKKFLIVLCVIFLFLIVFVIMRTPNQSYRVTDLVSHGLRLSDGSIALFIANIYSDQWGGSFAEVVVFDPERALMSRYSFSSNLLQNTDIMFEVAPSRDVIQIRLPGQNTGVRWSVSDKSFNTNNILSDQKYISFLELHGINWR